jgi:hypothetical protein
VWLMYRRSRCTVDGEHGSKVTRARTQLDEWAAVLRTAWCGGCCSVKGRESKRAELAETIWCLRVHEGVRLRRCRRGYTIEASGYTGKVLARCSLVLDLGVVRGALMIWERSGMLQTW